MRLLLILVLATTANAQWQIQQSHTTASLRGIHSLGSGVAWASGTQGTVLHTTDDGTTWQTCTTPPQAEKLDFRGIQAFDANTAIVMSSGKGDLSRLYKTTDACKTWRLVLNNPDKEGFWDAIQFASPVTKNKCNGVVLGDPVDRSFVLLLTYDCGEHWERQLRQPVQALKDEAIFAASNSSLALGGPDEPGERTFITGGPAGPRVITFQAGRNDNTLRPPYAMIGARPVPVSVHGWRWETLPVLNPSESAGAFSFARADVPDHKHQQTVIVGGDFKQPTNPNDTAWFLGPHQKWTPAQTPPHGYRSAVAYDTTTKTWITIGPNGTDISTDNGKNWQALKLLAQDEKDADQNWNALSLPFAVGPKGRIGKLNPTALKP